MLRFDDDAHHGEPSGPCAVAAMVLPSGKYVIELVVPEHITYSRLMSETDRTRVRSDESTAVKTARVKRPVLPGDRLLVSVSYRKPDEVVAGLYRRSAAVVSVGGME